MSSWVPDEATALQLAQLLEKSVSPRNEERRLAAPAFEEALRNEQIDRYLAFLLATTNPEIPLQVRGTAGMVLKNKIKMKPPTADELPYLEEQILTALFSPNYVVRNTASNTLTSLFTVVKLSGWPNLLPNLIEMIDSDNGDAKSGAMSALARVCEDSARVLDEPLSPSGDRPLNSLIPKLIQYCAAQDPNVRSNAVLCLRQFIPLESQAFLTHIDSFMQALFNLAEKDSYHETRKNLALSFNAFLKARPDKLIPYLDGIINFCLHCMNDSDEQVALEGAEFILSLGEELDVHEELVPKIAAQLPNIVPMLLEKLVYSDMDIMILESIDENDQKVEDRAQDIKPIVHHSKNARREPAAGGDDADDDEEGLEDGLEDWNLRKCCGASLDTLALRFAEQILPIAMPHLRQSLQSDQWAVRESAVLAFGAVSTGCIRWNVFQFIPELVPYLTKLLSDKNPQVRSISCWTLGRYGEAICEEQSLFGPVFQAVLSCGIDNNKRVQEAGCQALSVLSELAGPQIVPYTETLLHHFQQCFEKYQLGNLMALFECISTVVTAIGYTIRNPTYLRILVEPLLARWQSFDGHDRHVLPLLESLSVIAAFSGDSFANYAPAVFERAVNIIKEGLMIDERHRMDPTSCEPFEEREFLICAIDLIDGLVQGLQDDLRPLMATCNDPPLMDMIQVCFNDRTPEVRQSAFALIGDMAIYTFDDLRPRLPTVLPALIESIDGSDERFISVCNNATWATGEIALKIGAEMEPYFNALFGRIGSMLVNPDVAQSLRENAAIVVGRLGIALSRLTAPHLPQFIDSWFEVMAFVEETTEKDTAFQGICMSIGTNPSALTPVQVVAMLNSFASYYDPSPELKELVRSVVSGYRSLAENFDEIMAKTSAETPHQLHDTFGV